MGARGDGLPNTYLVQGVGLAEEYLFKKKKITLTTIKFESIS